MKINEVQAIARVVPVLNVAKDGSKPVQTQRRHILKGGMFKCVLQT